VNRCRARVMTPATVLPAVLLETIRRQRLASSGSRLRHQGSAICGAPSARTPRSFRITWAQL